MRKSACFPAATRLLLAACSLSACQPDQPPAAGKAALAAPVDSLSARPIEQRLGKTAFYLSLPPGFKITTTDGPDFLVHYFAPADTTVLADFTGGLYLGGHPQGDAADTAMGCRTRRVAATVLGVPTTFTIHRCATGYTLNSVFDSHSGQGWDSQINAFGEAKSAAGLRQLLAIFATLRRQPGPGKSLISYN